MEPRRVCVRLDSGLVKKLEKFKTDHNCNDTQAIKKYINITDDCHELLALHTEIGSKIVNIITAVNGLEDSPVKDIINHELGGIVCLLAK